MNILLINLTRFGDLLQTQPVIHGLKAQGHRIGLLCLENFAPAAALLDGVDHVAALPGSALLATLDADWRRALAGIHDVLHRLQQDFPADAVCNTTATLSARLLARRLAPTDSRILGFGMDDEGFGISGDIWATFLQGASAERCNCPFNIVDMFRAAAGVADTSPRTGLRPPDATVMQDVDALLRQCRPAETPEGYVAFQLGASEARRQWPVAHFAAVGKALWEKARLCPILLGSPAERPLAAAYAAASPAVPHIDAVGGTDIPRLAGILRRTRLLISNDTGTMHLAAGLGIPVLGIFLATAQPWDTGPYLPGCCCLEPALPCHPCGFQSPCAHENRCLHSISAETVSVLAHSFLREGAWPVLPPGADARAWLTGVDATGFADLHPLSAHGQEERSQWLRMQRHYYRHIIDGLNGHTRPVPASGVDTRGLSPLFRQDIATAMRQSEELLHLLCEQTALLRHMPGQQAGQRLLGTCHRIGTVLRHCRPLTALGHLWTVLAQERGESLDGVVGMATQLRRHLAAWREELLAVGHSGT